jgi:MFS family permease
VAPADPTSKRGWYAVAVLMLAYTLSFIDRQIIGLLVGPIQAELGLTDTQVGLTQGLAFAAFYTLLGLPMGAIVDRFNRRNLIVVGITLWSAMTALCGFGSNFGQLFLARMGVGVGEATLSPAALSIISDSFARDRLATAVSTYSMGVFIGAGLAFAVGGAVVSMIGSNGTVDLPLIGVLSSWRAAFVIVGVPGILVALLVLTIAEPRRTGLTQGADGVAVRPSLSNTLRILRSRFRSFAGISLGMAAHAVCMYGVFAWLPTYFVRRHGWSAGDAGIALGLAILVFGCAGMYAGGRLCDFWQQRGRRHAPLVVGALGAAFIFVGGLATLLSPSPALAVAMLIPLALGLALPIGCLFAALQLVFPNQARGQTSALYLFVISLLGISVGPLLPGLLNDYVFASQAAIGKSLGLTIGISALLMGLIFRSTYTSFGRDVDSVWGAQVVTP